MLQCMQYMCTDKDVVWVLRDPLEFAVAFQSEGWRSTCVPGL